MVCHPKVSVGGFGHFWVYREDFMRAAGCGIGAGDPKRTIYPCIIPLFCLKIQLEIDFHSLF